ncbi:MAG: cyclic nucleotide-binding domain-containing protein [Alphaproteobacteria bacterium]|nr:cyclic nucleotide-binding domain-containing protein [Alphaproteobacteria bacterium]
MDALDYATRYVALGTEIFQEGQTGRRAFLVEEGRVQLDRMVDGRRSPFAQIGPGGIFGEMAVIDGGPRTATATAVEDTTLVVISDRVFRHKLKTADPFLRALVRLFVANLRTSTPDVALRRPPSES